MPTWEVTPTSYAQEGGIVFSSMAPIEAAWSRAAPGDRIELAPGDYRRVTLRKSARPDKSDPVTIAAAIPHTPHILADVNIGSTDSFLLKDGVCDLLVDGLRIEVDDRAGVKTEGRGTRRVNFTDCLVQGLGSPENPTWKDPGKWGIHCYQDGGLSFVRCQVESVYQEHAFYTHNHQGNHAFSDCVTKWCGRTRAQFVGRALEGPICKGDIVFVDDDVEDVCLEQGGGGSAYTFRGGMPNTIVELERSKVRLGCNKALAAPFNANITGALLCDQAADAHPGGMAELHLIECDFERGSEYQGIGNARRSCVKIGAVGKLVIAGGRYVQNPACHKLLFEIMPSVETVQIVGDPVLEGGSIKFKQDPALYSSFADLLAQHPELRP